MAQLVILPALLLLVLQNTANAAVALVQTHNNATTSGTTVTATFTSATANNLLVVVCGARDSATLSITTPASGYSTAINEAGTPSQAIFYKVAGGGETTTTCTSSVTTRMGIHIYEYSGLVTSSVLDATGSSTGTSTSPATGNVTTTTANSLLIAGLVVDVDTTYSTWTNSFTERNDFANVGAIALRSTYGGADRIVTSTGTYSTSATTASGAWRGQIAAFKAFNPVLSVDIVNSSGASVTSPSVSMTTATFSFNCLTSTGTLGISSEKIRVTNYTTTATWTLSIAATSGATSNWTTGTNTYDFNDGGGAPAGCGDGGDTDTIAGQLTVNPSVSTLTPISPCTSTGVTKGSSTAYVEGTTNSVTLLTGGATAGTNCTWDLTGVGLSQRIPPEQVNGTYSLSLTLTIVAS
ncbi:hypothetical protein H0V99_01770 [Candidatus Saccharibacteria bacterium]|nr:hypothetical protein [Candidatus Saccharibacteria bacterium]